jgi:Glycosyl transferase family 11
MTITFSALGHWGRLGNQLFQIASTIGIATRHGYGWAFPEWAWQLWFTHSLPRYTGPELPDHFVSWGFRPDEQFPDNVSLSGYLQSERYFLHAADTVRHYFTLRSDRFRRSGSSRHKTAVHVRRGDYDGIYHLRLGKAYYDAAMATLRVTVEQCIFFTDDAQAVAEMYPGAAIAQGDTMQDLYSMTKCGRHIIANSTFSWWGAWLANAGPVVAPRLWFGDSAGLDTRDINARDWIVL